MAESKTTEFAAKPGAWVELALTLPIFFVYHLGVVFLGMQNATDFLTHGLMSLSNGDTVRYLGVTFAIGLFITAFFGILGRGQAFVLSKFVQIFAEGLVYAVLMRIGANYIVGRLFAGAIAEQGRLTGFIMSLGAGFYEEITFRVLLFGLGAKFLIWFFVHESVGVVGPSSFRFSFRSAKVVVPWALICAAIFSGVHYIGSLGDAFDVRSFLFRAVLGLALTLIYSLRGFGAAVWTHAIYDVWVLVFR